MRYRLLLQLSASLHDARYYENQKLFITLKQKFNGTVYVKFLTLFFLYFNVEMRMCIYYVIEII